MKKLFGTDGVRGKINIHPMTAEIALKLGMASASYFKKSDGKPGDEKLKVIIGKDTRLSGYVFEYALTSGLCSMGADVYLVGPLPTPAIAHLTSSFGADFGIMITASHNPAGHNGIKFFDSKGFKLPDEVEEQIEKRTFENNFEPTEYDKIGKTFKMFEVAGRYVDFAKKSIGNFSLKGMKIVLDCSNGAAYKVAPIIFSELGADIVVIGDRPDGLNINENCGSQCLQSLQSKVFETGSDLGIAYDGDADRLIAVDEKGDVVDGDDIMAIIAEKMIAEKKLAKNTLVATKYSNLALDKFVEGLGGKVIRVENGDRYVIEEMRSGGYNFGGEKTGHMIFMDYVTTGDGIISSLQLAKSIKESGKKFSQMTRLKMFPQVLLGIEVKEKPPIENLKTVTGKIKAVEEKLGDAGRVFVRYSGTEMKCRILVEGQNKEEIEGYANNIADAVKTETGG